VTESPKEWRERMAREKEENERHAAERAEAFYRAAARARELANMPETPEPNIVFDASRGQWVFIHPTAGPMAHSVSLTDMQEVARAAGVEPDIPTKADLEAAVQLRAKFMAEQARSEMRADVARRTPTSGHRVLELRTHPEKRWTLGVPGAEGALTFPSAGAASQYAHQFNWSLTMGPEARDALVAEGDAALNRALGRLRESTVNPSHNFGVNAEADAALFRDVELYVAELGPEARLVFGAQVEGLRTTYRDWWGEDPPEATAEPKGPQGGGTGPTGAHAEVEPEATPQTMGPGAPEPDTRPAPPPEPTPDLHDTAVRTAMRNFPHSQASIDAAPRASAHRSARAGGRVSKKVPVARVKKR
jgi:hypothetical protein